jgi:TolB-like protein/DNA-binding SARP family transcriptional activator
MTTLELDLFGRFQARAAGRVVEVPRRKERALLALLAMPPGERQLRDRLCGLLWSDRGEKQARDSLKQAVCRLRASFAPILTLPVLADRESLMLDRTSVVVDVARFEHHAAEGSPEAVAQAAALYRGDLLDGLEVGDAAFDEWLLIERQRFRGIASKGLETLLDRYVASGTHDRMGAVARQLLTLDPLCEIAHRALMQTYAEEGRATLALKQYQLCRDALQNELGVRPEGETERLYRAIKEKRATAGHLLLSHGSTRSSLLQERAGRRIDLERSIPVGGPPLRFSSSIAVLPFANLSGDPEQEYFCDGITEDIIVLLTRYRWLMVIARGSSFAYKGQATDVRCVGVELGAHYLVEGSVRKRGRGIRITAQLVDATDARELWAEQYDRGLEEVFTTQDDICRTIAAAIEAELSELEREIARRKDPDSLDAWDWHQRGLWHFYRFSNAGFAEAERMFRQAVVIEPALGRAHAGLALVQVQDAFYGDPAIRQPMLDSAIGSGQHAVGCDAKDAACHFALGRAYSLRRAYAEAIAELELAIELSPSFAQAHFALGHTLLWAGRAQEAIGLSDRAERLSPRDPHLWTFHHSRAQALFLLGDLKKAEEFGFKAIQQPNATYWPFATLVVTLATGGQLAKASAVAKELLRRKPNYNCRYVRQDFFFWNERDEYDTVERYVNSLARAGIPY